jgi:hypothetical protein
VLAEGGGIRGWHPMSSIFHLCRSIAAVSTDGLDHTAAMQVITTALRTASRVRLGHLPARQALVLDFVQRTFSPSSLSDIASVPLSARKSERLQSIVRQMFRPASNRAADDARAQNCDLLFITVDSVDELTQSISQEGCWSLDRRELLHKLYLESTWSRERLSLRVTVRFLCTQMICTGVSPEVLDYVCNSRIREYVCCGMSPQTMVPERLHGH